MVSEIFEKPKPILGKVQLLPLPGSHGWNGRWEPVIVRAEQEAMALATGGVDGLLIENTSDGRGLETAGAIAMARVAQRIKDFTGLPVGISVLPNDPETALAIAANIGADFVRVPVLLGSLLTENGWMDGKLEALQATRTRLKLTEDLKIVADLTPAHQFPLSLSGSAQDLTWWIAMAEALEASGVADVLLLRLFPGTLTPAAFATLTQNLGLPVWLEDHLPLDALEDFFHHAHGAVLGESVKKAPRIGSDAPAIVDLIKVEESVTRLALQRMPAGSPSRS